MSDWGFCEMLEVLLWGYISTRELTCIPDDAGIHLSHPTCGGCFSDLFR